MSCIKADLIASTVALGTLFAETTFAASLISPNSQAVVIAAAGLSTGVDQAAYRYYRRPFRNHRWGPWRGRRFGGCWNCGRWWRHRHFAAPYLSFGFGAYGYPGYGYGYPYTPYGGYYHPFYYGSPYSGPPLKPSDY